MSPRHEHKDFTLPRDPRFFACEIFPGATCAQGHSTTWLARMRKRALEEAERWMVERIGEGSDVSPQCFPP